MLARVEVEHEVGEGALKACTGTEVEDEAGAGDLGGAIKVQDVQGFTELPVGPGGEVEGGLNAPGFFFAVGVLVATHGDRVLGQIGDGLEDVAETIVSAGC